MDTNYTLHKYLNGEATADEIEKLKSSPEYASYIKIAEATSDFEAPPFNAEMNFELINSKRIIQKEVKRIQPLSAFLRIAAVLAVVLIGYLYVSSLDTTISTQIAEKESFLLPDTSEVILNANSEIVYNKKSWKGDRSLTLDGEAYFKVTKGSSFSVKTAQGVVTVLGTQFNVFSRDSKFSVNCFEGLVSVSFNDTLVKLPAGNIIKIENGSLVVHTPSNSLAPTWITDESHFENDTFHVVLKELERQYPITITAKNVDVNRRFTGSFTHNDLNVALKSVCDPLGLQYTITDGEVNIYAKNQ
jgi:ferric-dicitrate binding protein FerR (iron transport regulator)